MRKYNVAVIGLGKVGQTRIRVINEHKDLKLIAVSDIREELRAEYPDLSFSSDHKDIVENVDVDMVFVATTNKYSTQIVCDALAAGKHVFCEKPPGRCVEDVEAIRSVEKKCFGQKLQFGFNHRYHYGALEAKNIIDSGVLGKVLWARGVYGKMGGADFEGQWRSDPDVAGGGILLDQGIHMLDLFRHLMGDFEEIQSTVQTMYWDIPMEDNAFAILKTKSNQVAMIHSSATQWHHKFNLEVCLEEGYLNLTGILSSTRSYGDETLVYARKDLHGLTGKLGNPNENKIYFDEDHSWELEVDAFVGSIKENKPVEWGNSQDALKSMELVFGIYEADGGRMNVDVERYGKC